MFHVAAASRVHRILFNIVIVHAFLKPKPEEMASATMDSGDQQKMGKWDCVMCANRQRQAA